MKRTPKLNVQGLSRREANLMNCILPRPGYIVCSADCSSGEPTVTAHYSQDKNYYDATFGMVGKAPYYQGQVLKIDDIYLTAMSISPFANSTLRAAFNTTYSGNTFSQQWLIDSEVVKKELKKPRQLSKLMVLGLSYGMYYPKLVKTAYENGHSISLSDAKTFYNAYWQLFSGVRSLANRLSFQIKRDGYIVNQFGYRLCPEPRKAFNYLIQSSISGLFHIFCAKVFALAPYAIFITVIHDELVCEVPIDKQDDFRQVILKATESLNADLNWSVKLRFGCVFGKDWFDAK